MHWINFSKCRHLVVALYGTPADREDRYMTQYILSGIGHLKQLGALPKNDKLNLLIKAGISYLDQQIKKDYEDLKKNNKKAFGRNYLRSASAIFILAQLLHRY